MRQKIFKTFLINGGTFDFDIHVCISNDFHKAASFINKKLHLPSKNALIYTTEDFIGKNGLFMSCGNYCPILWIPSIPKTPEEYGTLFHEIFHGIAKITRWCNVILCEESEETFCHLIKHLTKQILRKIKC